MAEPSKALRHVKHTVGGVVPVALILPFVLLLSFFGVTGVAVADDGHDVYRSDAAQAFANVKRHSFFSEALGQQRQIDVALPVNYFETAATHKYPVVIVMDGELMFPMVSGLVHQMSANSQMPDAIVVGINNVVGARRDITPKPFDRDGKPYWFGGQEDAYLSFLTDEALALVAENYRAADFRVLIGLSPTAQFTLHAFWKAPEAFDGYVAINATDFTAVGYDGETVFDKIVGTARMAPERPAYLYVSMPQGGVERNPKIREAYERITQGLTPFASKGIAVKTEVIDREAYAATLPAVMSALEMIFPARDFDPAYNSFFSDVPGETLQNVRAYFDALSQRYGFAVLPKGERFYNRNRLKRIGYYFLQEGRNEEAIEAFAYWLQFYPHSPNAHDSMADALEKAGRAGEAKAYREKAVALARQYHDGRLALFEQKLAGPAGD